MKNKELLRLIWFLFRNHALYNFYKEIKTKTNAPKNLKQLKKALNRGIAGAFLWQNTKQGTGYWQNLEKKWYLKTKHHEK